jgi:ribose/xylose/arabinose/galactoside ABC-type transport system permease subunit
MATRSEKASAAEAVRLGARVRLPAEVDWQVVLLAVALAGMGVFFSLRSPHFLAGENLANVIRHAAIVYIIAAGQTITILSAGIDLSQGMVASLVSVVAVDTILKFGITAGTFLGLLTGAAAGLFTGLMVAYVRVQPFLSTVGMLYIAGGLALVFTSGRTLFFIDVTGKRVEAPVFFWLGQGHLGPVPVPVLVALAVAGLLYLLMTRTPFGRYVYAIGGNEEAAAMSGVPVQRVKVAIYVVSGICVAVALPPTFSRRGRPRVIPIWGDSPF